jgi:nicotinamide-nucleotide amidase
LGLAASRPSAAIVTIGNEILVGRIVNTNASWLASRLTLLGSRVRRIITVGDVIDEIVWAIKTAMSVADIVVVTGGLGPTDDDMTAEALAAALNRPLILNREALRMVEEFYRRHGQPMSPERAKMAYLPAGAAPIPNPVGAAPGIHVQAGKVELFSLPGVPREMKAMFEDYVVKAIEYMLPKLCVVEEGKVVKGIPEADLAPLLRVAARECGDCYVKSHPKGHEGAEPVVDIRVLSSAPSCEEAKAKAARVLARLEEMLGDRRGGQ